MLTVTATDLTRIMNCNGSLSMKTFESPTETDNPVKDEGNAADWVVQKVFNKEFDLEELIDRRAENGVFITGDMIEYLQEYLEVLLSSNLETHVETDTSHSGEKWCVNGRADSILFDRQRFHLYVNDLKYGWSIVEPEMNWTLLSHALGFILKNDLSASDVRTISLTIHQPRAYHPLGNVRTWVVTIEELFEFYNQIDDTLNNPKNELHTGEHCYKCPSMIFCTAFNKAKSNAIEASEKVFNDDISNERLAFELDHLKRAATVIKQLEKAYNELAFHKVKTGQIVPNYSLQNDYGQRAWKEFVTPEIVKVMTGVDVSKQALVSPAQAEKLGVSKEVISSMVEKKLKGSKLVRVDSNKKAQKMFNTQ